MKKRAAAFIITVVLILSMQSFAYANSTVIKITDSAAYKAENLTGNSLNFTVDLGTVEYRISSDALTEFYKDGSIKYYSFTYGDFNAKLDKNGFYDFDLDHVNFILSKRSVKANFVYKDKTSKEITQTLTENVYTVTSSDITGLSVAKFGKDTVFCDSNTDGVLKFTTNLIGAFTVFDYKFSDVDAKKWYYECVNKSGAYGILSGMGDGTFAPQANITRAQLAAMIVKATGKLISYREDGKHKFSDVAKSKWYYTYVTQCATLGLMEGTGEGKFEPEKNATRQEIAAVITRVLRVLGSHGGKPLPEIDKKTCQSELKKLYRDASDIHGWAAEYVLFCNKLQIMVGDGDGFRPKSNITRAESAKIFWLIFSENV